MTYGYIRAIWKLQTEKNEENVLDIHTTLNDPNIVLLIINFYRGLPQ